MFLSNAHIRALYPIEDVDVFRYFNANELFVVEV